MIARWARRRREQQVFQVVARTRVMASASALFAQLPHQIELEDARSSLDPPGPAARLRRATCPPGTARGLRSRTRRRPCALGGRRTTASASSRQDEVQRRVSLTLRPRSMRQRAMRRAVVAALRVSRSSRENFAPALLLALDHACVGLPRSFSSVRRPPTQHRRSRPTAPRGCRARRRGRPSRPPRLVRHS